MILISKRRIPEEFSLIPFSLGYPFPRGRLFSIPNGQGIPFWVDFPQPVWRIGAAVKSSLFLFPFLTF